MTTYLVRRALQAAVVLVLISMLVFGFLWLLPGGPQQAILAGDAQGAALHALRHDYGIGSPAVVEYLHWLGQVLSG
ncbi:MAG TPA: ABC transporter permease, partial [Streptosporangiaceae bacterium]|nr:ABC transporter permease [Streptosporangiaceae bacterium]